MKLSIIWQLTGTADKDQKTFTCLKKQTADLGKSVQILIYGQNVGNAYSNDLAEDGREVSAIDTDTIEKDSNIFEDAKKRVSGDYVTFLKGGDIWSDGALKILKKEISKRSNPEMIMMKKLMPDGKVGAFGDDIAGRKIVDQVLRKSYYCYPYYFGGTVISIKGFQSYKFKNELGLEMERSFFLHLCATKKKILFLGGIKYKSATYYETNKAAYKGQEMPEWYERSFAMFWLPFLEEMKRKYGQVPVFIQYHLMFTIKNHIMATHNGKCPQGITEEMEQECTAQIRKAIKYVNADVLFNCHNLKETEVPNTIKWYYGRLKQGKKFHFDKKYMAGVPYYGSSDTIFQKIAFLKTKITAIRYENGCLVIDGMADPLLVSMADEVYFMFNKKKYSFFYDASYVPQTALGREICRTRSFCVRLPFAGIKDCQMLCFANFGDESIKIPIDFSSAFSHFTEEGSFWFFGEYKAVRTAYGLRFTRISEEDRQTIEKETEKELSRQHTKETKELRKLRKEYYHQMETGAAKKIWVFAGDDADRSKKVIEFYRYVNRDQKNISAYYIADETSTAYAKLQAEGFTPVVRGSFQYKLLMLQAELIIASGYSRLSEYDRNYMKTKEIKDLVDVRVCYLDDEDVKVNGNDEWPITDNIRYYFCMSIDGTMRMSDPAYGFFGRNKLRIAEQYSDIYRYLVSKEVRDIGIDDWKPQSEEGLVDYQTVTTEGSEAYEKRQECMRAIETFARESQMEIPSASERKTITDQYYESRIVPGRVALVGLGKNVRGSMQYVLNELNYNDAFKDFHVYVRVDSDTESIVREYISRNKWVRTEPIITDSQYAEIQETAQFLLTEVFFPYSWTKKKGQMYINIWHGTPLKKLGLAKNANGKHRNGIQQINFIEADYLLYPNEYTKIHMLESYKVSELMQGKILNLGYPRTGGMLEAAQSDQTELRNQLAPNGEHIYAYMPTWRDYLKVEQVVAESKELLDYLDENLRDDQILYVNLHHRVSDSLDYSVFKHIKQFPPTVDSYKLLALTDALITDYSSVFYDYLALRKQIVLYCADYNLYREKRGTYMNLMDLPFDKALTKEAVLEAINRGKIYDDEAVYKEFCSYDSVENAHKLCSLFLGTEKEVDVEEIPKSDKKRVLVYSDTLTESPETEWLRQAVKLYENGNVELFASCNQDMVDKKSAYPLLNEIPVIGTTGVYYPSAMGRVAKALYKKGEITVDQAVLAWKYDYASAARRFYGHAKFDLVVLYDVIDPQKLFTLTFIDMPNKIMVISESMYKELMINKNTLMMDAVCACAPYMRAIFVKNEEQYAAIKHMLGDLCPVHYMTNANELVQVINAAVDRKGE